MGRCVVRQKVGSLARTLFRVGLILSALIGIAISPFVAAQTVDNSDDVCTSGDPAISLATVTAPSSSTLGKGKFLIASRDLSDPNFAESVILLLDYNAQGALGVIINRPTEVPLANLLPGVKALQKRKDVAYFGGPVAQHMLMILTRAPKPPQDSQHVFSDVYLVSQQAGLDHQLRTQGPKTKVRAYIGYAGWAAGQLDMEVARRGWHVVPADSAFLFDKADMDTWPELIRRGEALWTDSPPVIVPALQRVTQNQ